ncbi:translin-associated protein X [Epargyreus clarus]|uniref:translin-associated protein X n=1 Tax=Epargyreus clarus TaxID=520877 RepID=UPI003C2E2CBF
MSSRGRYRGNRNRNQQSCSSREPGVALAPDSPVLAMFRSAAVKLNARQDRHERLVKLSRDITIESKRIIFLLHSAISKESTEKAVSEAKERLNKLLKGPIKSVGLELENSAAYLHSHAVTAGFQEFIEARTLCSLMESRYIVTYDEVKKEFQNTVKDSDEAEERTVTTLLPCTDYILGISDLTGELMRRAINSISSGDSEECFYVCQVVRDLYTGYLGLYRIGKELARKMNTTRNNVAKVEAAVYALRLRGGEAPPLLLLTRLPEPEHHSDDEGFY